MPDEASAPAMPSTPPTLSGRWRHVTFGVSLSRVQAIVGTLAGIVSITGALFSVSPLAQVFANGELVATVQEAGSHRAVTDATIEVLTTQNQVVATLTPDASGRASHDLKEGAYVVRVSHPRYAVDVRRVQVFSRQTVEIRATLHAGSSSTVERAVTAVRKALRF
jgi:hypothetical protein